MQLPEQRWETDERGGFCSSIPDDDHDYHDLGRGDGYGHESLDQIKRIIDSVLWWYQHDTNSMIIMMMSTCPWQGAALVGDDLADPEQLSEDQGCLIQPGTIIFIVTIGIIVVTVHSIVAL